METRSTTLDGRFFLGGGGAALSPCPIFCSIKFFQGVGIFVGLPFRGHALDELFGHPHFGLTDRFVCSGFELRYIYELARKVHQLEHESVLLAPFHSGLISL